MIEAVRSAHPETPGATPAPAPGAAGGATRPQENGG
jgi:hypothetical protein